MFSPIYPYSSPLYYYFRLLVFHPLSGIDSQPARKFISPKIAVHLHPGDKNQPYEGSICVKWTENTTGNGDVNDNGTSFGSTQNLGAYLGKSSAAQIAVYQDNVYVVWSDDTTGRGDIYFRASLDNGAKFGGQKQWEFFGSPNNVI